MKPVSAVLEANSYRRKLDTPQWRQFAAATKQRRGGGCQCCKRTDLGLHVHHIFYENGREPWEYGDDEVVVLCPPCHKEMHEQLKKFRKYVFGRMTPRILQIVNGSLAVAFEKYEPLVFAHALAEFVSTPSMIQRYADAWGVEATAHPDGIMERKL